MVGYVRLLAGVFFLLASGCASSGGARPAESGKSAGVTKISCIPDRKTSLPEYEKLTYQAHWMGIPAGTLTSTVKGISLYEGRRVYVLEAEFKTNAFLSSIYRIDDRFVSYVDTEKLCSLRHEVYRREGSHQKNAVTCFDQDNRVAYFRNSTDGSEKSFAIPSCVQDTLSASYYFHFFSLEVGKRIEYAVCSDEKIYNLFALVEAKTTIRLPGGLGTQEAFRIQPYAKLNGKRMRKGNMRIYYSADANMTPLYGIIRGPLFTSVTLRLEKVERNGEWKDP